MKSKQLYEQHGLRTFLLVMDKGDEAFEQITTFAREHKVTAASLTAIGATTSATLGYFDPEIVDYRSTRFDEQMEICSLIGDIASKDGEPRCTRTSCSGARTPRPSAATCSRYTSSRRWKSCSPRHRHICANVWTPRPAWPSSPSASPTAEHEPRRTRGLTASGRRVLGLPPATSHPPAKPHAWTSIGTTVGSGDASGPGSWSLGGDGVQDVEAAGAPRRIEGGQHPEQHRDDDHGRDAAVGHLVGREAVLL